jgi:hypothetical protein
LSQKQVGALATGRLLATKQAENLAGLGDGQGRTSTGCRKPGTVQGTRPRPSICARGRIVEASRFDRTPERRRESRMPARAPVTELSLAEPQGKAARRDIGRQAYPGAREQKVCRTLAKPGCQNAGESGVGSNAGPICLASLRCDPTHLNHPIAVLRPNQWRRCEGWADRQLPRTLPQKARSLAANRAR